MSSLDLRIEALYREIEAARHELVGLLKERAQGPVDDYLLAGPQGPVRLSALFGDKDELIVSFNLGAHSPFCTLWADEADGVLRHLQQQAAFVLVSPDPVEVQTAFAASRGWRLPMASHQDSSFARDMGFAHPQEDGTLSLWPGVSTFRRVEGRIERVGMNYYVPGDPFCSVFHFFSLLHSEGEGFAPQI